MSQCNAKQYVQQGSRRASLSKDQNALLRHSLFTNQTLGSMETTEAEKYEAPEPDGRGFPPERNSGRFRRVKGMTHNFTQK